MKIEIKLQKEKNKIMIKIMIKFKICPSFHKEDQNPIKLTYQGNFYANHLECFVVWEFLNCWKTSRKTSSKHILKRSNHLSRKLKKDFN